jgi:exodeoxyribonuclease-5
MSIKMFSEDQTKAAECIKSWFKSTGKDPFRLSGLAGTGKSTVTAHLSEILEAPITYLGPTGKSAAVLRNKGVVANTIHSTIYEPSVNQRKRRVDYVLKMDLDDKPDLIVVDEASMVGEELQRDIEYFGIKVLYVGDPFQLPPVGSSTNHMELANISLTKLHRFAETNEIYLLSQRIRQGEMIKYGKVGENVKKSTKNVIMRPETLIKADMILCGRNSTRNTLNQIVRQKKRMKGVIQEGERIIITKNNKDTGFVNGDMGTIIEVGKESKDLFLIEVKYRDDQQPGIKNLLIDTHAFYGIDLVKEAKMSDKKFKMANEKHRTFADYGYALTVNKAQGSEWNNVIVIEEPIGENFTDRQRWLYTAVTRAKESLVIGG